MTTPASDGRSDQELLRAHVDGDPDAFGELFARHRDRLWAVALRTMGNPDDAADGLQDGMVAAFRRAGSFRGEAAVTTWLHRVVVNACLDRLRAAKIRRFDALPDDVDDRGTVVATAALDDRPDEAAEAAERRRRVLDALATLPPEQRAALVLVDMEGYPVAEVAEMLGCAEGTVKSRCSRGRTRLAGLLGDLHHPAGDPPHGNPPSDGPVQPSVRPRGPPAP
jgi:RNA polymerase sigma-70 factor (ECF subfamily)